VLGGAGGKGSSNTPLICMPLLSRVIKNAFHTCVYSPHDLVEQVFDV
jgi:hypothetical protein